MVVASSRPAPSRKTDVRDDVVRCVELVKRCHREMPRQITGPGTIFWVFHVLRDYAHTLEGGGHRTGPTCRAGWRSPTRSRTRRSPLPIVFGHHDLLPANFMDDGKRLWLIDWEYGAFGTAMFDLANIASNNSFRTAEEAALLEIYFEKAPDEATAARLRCDEDGLGLARSDVGHGVGAASQRAGRRLCRLCERVSRSLRTGARRPTRSATGHHDDSFRPRRRSSSSAAASSAARPPIIWRAITRPMSCCSSRTG